MAALAALLASAPSFALGGVLVVLLSVRLRWLPVAGDATPWHLVLPVVTLAAALAPGLARVARHGMAEAHGAYATQFARMRGVAPWRIGLRVVARPALVPVVAYLPVLAMQVTEGFIAIEMLFNLDGIGQLLIRSLMARDLPVVAALGLVFALLLGAATLLAELSLRAMDPRLRAGCGGMSHRHGAAHRRFPGSAPPWRRCWRPPPWPAPPCSRPTRWSRTSWPPACRPAGSGCWAPTRSAAACWRAPWRRRGSRSAWRWRRASPRPCSARWWGCSPPAWEGCRAACCAA
ncbi:ABC transporter permease subunit [Teichococcus aestuarii]|uniref:ABC transporter permease subunit n=1 Tax=Teichococcus aestuarii TaxID=568898 RepID=UPI00361E4DE0